MHLIVYDLLRETCSLEVFLIVKCIDITMALAVEETELGLWVMLHIFIDLATPWFVYTLAALISIFSAHSLNPLLNGQTLERVSLQEEFKEFS